MGGVGVGAEPGHPFPSRGRVGARLCQRAASLVPYASPCGVAAPRGRSVRPWRRRRGNLWDGRPSAGRRVGGVRRSCVGGDIRRV